METRSNRSQWGILAGYVALHAALHWYFGPQFIDDAFITFRYAERIAAGKGFTFNDGVAVLGTTTPLWTFLFAAFRSVGVSLGVGNAILASLSGGVFSFCLWRIFRSIGRGWTGLLVGPALLTSFVWAGVNMVGMETVLSVALAAALAERVASNRSRGVGILAALSFLTRPEGAVLGAIAFAWLAWRALREGKPARKALTSELAVGAMAAVPWIVFAIIEFGSFVPHSVAAKQVVHHASFSPILEHIFSRVLAEPFARELLILAAVGVIAIAVRWRRMWLLPAWTIAYVFGLASSGVNPSMFFWYFAPITAGVWFTAALGVCALAGLAAHALGRIARRGERARSLRVPNAVSAFVLLTLLVWQVYHSGAYILRQPRDTPGPMIGKEQMYAALARRMDSEVRPGSRVLVGEVGVFCYYWDQAEILDSAGINSPDVLEFVKRADQEGNPPGWVLPLLRDLKPDWIVTLDTWVGGAKLVSTPTLAPDYEVWKDPEREWPRMAILKRKDAQ